MSVGDYVCLRNPALHYRHAVVRSFPVFGVLVEKRCGPSPWRKNQGCVDLWLFKPGREHALPAIIVEEKHVEQVPA